MSELGTGDIEQRIARLEQQDQRLTRALELLASHETAPAAKAGRNWNAYAAVIASFVGVLALAISGYTAYVQRQQLRAQVWPHLEIWYSSVNLVFMATNQGTGPARVTAMRVTVGGAPVRNWSELAKVAGFTGAEGFASGDLRHAVLSPGKEFTILKPRDDEPSRTRFRELFPGHTHALAITVCYCSVLDDCWVASDSVDDNEVQPRDACPIPAGESFAE